MATSTAFSYASALRGSAGRDGDSQRPPVQVPPLHHVPALSANAVFIDLRVVKPSVTTEERNDFLLEDLRVSVDEVSKIWPAPESQLLRLAFFTADQHKRYLDRLTAGVPWSACRAALVYGWSPGDAVTAVRLTGVPASLPDAAIREHFSQFGRVTRVFRSKDKVFTRAANGIAHISIAVAPGFTLPAFVSLVDADGCTDKRMLVHTDASRRRCSRCGTTGHVAQFCRAGRRAAGADAALWSVIRIPADLLPAADAAMDTAPARPPPSAAAAASVSRWFTSTPPTAEGEAADAAASQPAASNTTHVSSTPSISTPSLPGGDSAAGAVVAAWEAVDPTGGEAPATGAASTASAAALPATADSDAPAAGSATPSLVLQVSGLSDTPSLPLGQGAQLPASLSDSTASLPMLSPLSSISSSSLQSAKSRDPRLNRSVSANSRKTESDMESDEPPSVAAARTGRKRGLTGGRNGPKKASKKQSGNRSVSPPSQHISQSASP